MRLTVLGSSPSFPNPGEASSAYLIEDGETRVLLEAGHGAASVLPTVVDPRDLSAIVISHMHPDHYLDLVPLTYALRFHYRREALPLLLPPGGLATFEALWEPLHLSKEHFMECFDAREYAPADGLGLGRLRITFAHTEHFIPAFAMRFHSSGSDRSFGYSSDTQYTTDVVDLLRGVSLALIEATYVEATGEPNGHLDATTAGKIAREAGVERLILTHYEQSLGECLAESASRAWGGPAELAKPLATYEM